MKIGITGALGFLGSNLSQVLSESQKYELILFSRDNTTADLSNLVDEADWIFHFAGINRPQNDKEFEIGNTGLTEKLVALLQEKQKQTPVVLSSSIQAERDNAYGKSKLGAEQALLAHTQKTGAPIYIYRLPNLFGKWSRPNYNSVVSTFCYKILNDEAISINDPKAELTLAYIDDVINELLDMLDGQAHNDEQEHYYKVPVSYKITLGQLANQIQAFKDSRNNLITEAVGVGLTRALYSTYLSYMRPKQFSYTVPEYVDPRGKFSELLKTRDSGQFSFFTAKPGITRGGHYHHSKNEKFVVLSGEARFGFRHTQTNEYYEKFVTGDKIEVVETIPGWTHDITNTGDTELVVWLWANEIFDRDKPDTFNLPVKLT